jgi:hypothetical protein
MPLNNMVVLYRAEGYYVFMLVFKSKKDAGAERAFINCWGVVLFFAAVAEVLL